MKFRLAVFIIFLAAAQIKAGSFGISVPLVKDKIYIGPYLDFHSPVIGGIIDGGLIYTRKDMEAISNKKWLGYYFDGYITANLLNEHFFNIKTGIGYSFHHLIHIDETLRYHAMPVLIKISYRFPTGMTIFYQFNYPLLKNSEFHWEQKFMNQIGIGFNF